MRIVVNIPTESYKELIAELEKIKPRDRAERMRILAMFGLEKLNSKYVAYNPINAEEPHQESYNKKQQTLQNKLIDSLR